MAGVIPSTHRSRSGRLLPPLVVFLVALVLRLVYLLQSADNPLFGVHVVDAASYDQWADRILQGRWFYDRVMIYTPVYPAFLALLKFLAGAGPWVYKIVQGLMGAGTAVLIFFITARAWGRLAGLLAGLLAGTAWMGVIFDAEAYSETFAVFFMCLALFLAGTRNRSAAVILAAGLALGLSSGARVNLLLLAPAFVIWGFRRDVARGWKIAARNFLVLCLGMAAILAPIAWRNHGLCGKYVLRVQGTWNFYSAMNPEFGGFYPPAGARFNKYMLEPIQNGMKTDIEFERYWGERAKDVMAGRPLEVARLFAKRALIFLNAREWSQEFDVNGYRSYSAVLSLPFWPGFWLLVPMGCAAVVLLRRGGRGRSLLFWCLLLAAASVIFFKSSGRFRLPVAALLSAYAGGAGAVMWRLAAERAWRRLAPAAALIAVGAVLALPDWPDISGNQTARNDLFVGERLLAAGRHDDAIAVLDRSAARFPWDPDSPYLAARALAAKGDLAAAMDRLKIALAREPVFPEALAMQGEILLKTGDMEGARRKAEQAVAMHPGSREGWLLTARVCGITMDREGEDAAYRKAYRSGAEAGVFIAYGLELEGRGEVERAVEWYGMVAADRTFHSFNRARCCMLAGNLLARKTDARDRMNAWWGMVLEEFRHEIFFAQQAAFLKGLLTEEEYRRAAGSLKSATAEEFCEYNIGLRTMLDGNPGAAEEGFRKVLGDFASATNAPAELPQKWAWEELQKTRGPGTSGP